MCSEAFLILLICGTFLEKAKEGRVALGKNSQKIFSYVQISFKFILAFEIELSERFSH